MICMSKVLFLEDDEEQRELGEELLEMKTGIEVDTKPSVEEVEDWNYDLAITDYSGVDVETVYDNIDNVIVYTGFSEESIDLPEYAQHVEKPDYDELADEVQRQLETYISAD